MKVVAIEDDQETQYLISLAFEFNWGGVEILSALNGREGLRLLEDQSPDLVILDLSLPDMDGFEVIGKIQRVYDVPVIFLTAREEDVIKGADASIIAAFNESPILKNSVSKLFIAFLPVFRTISMAKPPPSP